MVHEEKKIAKIVEELMMYFFAIGAENLSYDIKRKGNDVTITFRSDYLPEYEHEIKKLEEYLDEPKNEGMEDMYWELAGSGDPGESSQLLLIGMMIDRHEVKMLEHGIELVLYKELWL